MSRAVINSVNAPNGSDLTTSSFEVNGHWSAEHNKPYVLLDENKPTIICRNITVEAARELGEALIYSATIAENKRPIVIPGGFKDGDIVVGPFFGKSGTGLGTGIVDSTVKRKSSFTDADDYVPVRITDGSRPDGGYFPNNLTKVVV